MSSGGARRRLGVALAGGRDERGRGGRARAAAPPTRRTATTGSVSTFAGCSCVPSTRNTEPPGTEARSRAAPRTRVPLEPDLDLVAVAHAEPVGVGGRELDDLARPHEPQRRARGRPPAPPTASARCRAAARRRSRAAGGGRDARARPAPTARRRSALGGLARRPAHAAPADRVERQPRVERHGGEQLLRGHRPGHARRGRAPARSRHLGDDLPARAHARRRAGPGGRSRAAAAARGRRDATSVPSFSA